jgi:hypothetical protein
MRATFGTCVDIPAGIPVDVFRGGWSAVIDGFPRCEIWMVESLVTGGTRREVDRSRLLRQPRQAGRATEPGALRE